MNCRAIRSQMVPSQPTLRRGDYRLNCDFGFGSASYVTELLAFFSGSCRAIDRQSGQTGFDGMMSMEAACNAYP